MAQHHFVIVGLDGLRADMVSPETTPNFLRLAQQGVHFSQHHSVFPTATRVNIASLVTGAYSGTHGIVNNAIFEPAISSKTWVDLGKYDVVEAADAHYRGQLLCTPSLGEILAEHGDTMLAISSGTTGSNRLMHHKVKTLGGVGFSAHGIPACYPADEAEAVVAKFGPAPAMGMPDSARAEYITNVFLHHLFPRHQARVTILWFSDPDKTYHALGIGSPESLQAIRAVDAQLGRLLDWSQESDRAGRVNVLALSDHGHVTVRDKVSVNEALSADVTPAGRGYYTDQVAVVPSLTGEIHVRHHDPKLVSRIAHWLMSQPWCGSVFTQGQNEVEGIVPGTLARSLVGNDHARSGDIVYIMRTNDERNTHGLPGSCYDDSSLPLGGSTHGGLSPYELQNVFAAAGPDFRAGHSNSLPSGTVDVMPTLLHLMGYPIPPSVDGRVLSEALALSAGADGAMAEPAAYGVAAKGRSYCQYLETTRVDKTVYLERAWVEG
jgi:predicted AlkP superfamily pyrophosphatase or phosphodiesterase